ncbi:cyclic peptide export ABC transporter [Hansschlegelia sp.]|uniref:cyclic peptide export ABC transporter n=1 Tax=Hansschlegelia sp. TaxID=2041892 RepID=UPI002BE59F8B|nr:cyclic peptide export ABC transporter [Hansschlegelia sp.]HVI27873.1 cyclic peptide export ABC transporter [Hansschlegelia sp.]
MNRPSGDRQLRALIAEALRLLRPVRWTALLATTAGVVGGVATAGLLAGVNSALIGSVEPSVGRVAELACLCALSLVGTAVAGALNSMVGQMLIAALRKDISARILRAPLRALESLRAPGIMAVLTNDIDTVSAFTFNFSGYAVALAVTLGAFVYLLALSPVIFLLALVSLAAGSAVNLVAKRIWVRDYEAVRTASDELHKQYAAIIDGAKELKISRPRRARVYGVLLAGAAERIAALKTRAMALFWIADAVGSALFFVVICLLLAASGRLGVDRSVISGAALVLLYVKGPLERLAGALPVLDQAQVSFRRITKLSEALEQSEPRLSLIMDSADSPTRMIRSLELRNVTYSFGDGVGARSFTLGPLDLTVHAGELLFIVGANGSGKTTLVKILLGLYAPDAGEVLLDGTRVEPERRDEYRQLFSTVFSDYYLFDDLAYGAASDDARRRLDCLGLAGEVRIEDGRFSTTDLSTGQRKRLALIQAYAEGRPILVTDEWAADQDPEFRRRFYEELLPGMKSGGRTLIVISHDDRYFHVADRVIEIREGKIVWVRKGEEGAL